MSSKLIGGNQLAPERPLEAVSKGQVECMQCVGHTAFVAPAAPLECMRHPFPPADHPIRQFRPLDELFLARLLARGGRRTPYHPPAVAALVPDEGRNRVSCAGLQRQS